MSLDVVHVWIGGGGRMGGHHIEHGWTIEVIAEDGFVVLRGNVLRDQLEDAVSTARDVHGVRKVWSEMRVRNSPGESLPLPG